MTLGLAASAFSLATLGWRRSLHPELEIREGDRVLLRARAPIRLDSLHAAGGLGSKQARWRGVWRVSEAGTQRLSVRSDAGVRIWVDGRLVLSRRPEARSARTTAAVPVEAGYRPFVLELAGPVRELRLRLVEAGGAGREFAASELMANVPSPAGLAALRLLGLAPAAAAVAWIGAALCGLLLLARMPREARAPRLFLRYGPPALAVLIVLFGAALRLEALIERYWVADRPAWAQRIVPVLHGLHPSSLQWQEQEDPYEGDPFAYLRHARRMRHFYEARFREPLFVFAAKVGVRLAGGRDLGISFASAAFSAWTVLAVYLLGAVAHSRTAGLIAAAGIAIDQAVISLSAEGWRDDAFAFWVVLTALASLVLHDSGSRRAAIGLGLAGAAATLTRITSFSLVLPLLAALLVVPGNRPLRARARRVALAAAVFALLVGPFLISCAIAFGDPFYSINAVSPAYYVGGEAAPANASVAHFLRSRFRPFELLDTALVGFTAYPFAHKWHLGVWWEPLGPLLAAASLAGGLLFLLRARERLLWLAWAGALLPFVFTWNVPGGDAWRLTLHAYPFYLVAAGAAIAAGARVLLSAGARTAAVAWLRELRPRRATLAATAALAVAWTAWRPLYALRVREAVHAGEAAPIAAGPRDAWFFGPGWYPPVAAENMWLRHSRGRSSEIRLPLQAGRAYQLTLRIDPFAPSAQPQQALRVLLNGQPLGVILLGFDADRFGSYEVELPAPLVRPGRNLLVLQPAYTTRAEGTQAVVDAGWDVGFVLWYLTLTPRTSSGAPPA